MDPTISAPRTARSVSPRLIPCVDPDSWDRAVRTLPGGTAFHDWDFLALQERLFGYVVDRLVVELDGRPAGVLPVARRSRRSPRAPWIEFPFLGPVVPESAVPAALAALRRHQWRHGLVLARFDVAPELADAVGAVPAGMRVVRDGTVRVPLEHGSEERLDARMGKSRRRLIRRAAEDGVIARPAVPGETAAVLGPALEAAYTRRGTPNPYPMDIGATIEAWASMRPEVLLSVAERDGRVLAVDVTLATHPVAAAWIGARAAEAVDGHADAVLTRHVLLTAMARGHTALDLAGRVDDDVERYKLSFGGEALPYLTVESLLVPEDLRRLVAGRS